MAEALPPPGGGTSKEHPKAGYQDHHGKADDVPKNSYADRLKTNVRFDQRLQRNILEIVLEKHRDVEVDLDHECIAKLLKSIGIDIQNQVEGYFIKQKIISVWLVKGIDLDRFCKEESIRVAHGITTSFIRPAGRIDVTVSVCGLDFNTPDTFLIEYLNKFGTVLGNNVIYSKYKEGPFKGKYTGERKYQVDFSNSRKSMGTYHFVDGARVRIFYRGNIKTCARCHQIASDCPGEARAKDCEQKNGPKLNLSDHMRSLWNEVGFVPTSFTLTNTEDEPVTFDAPVKNTDTFAPKIDKPKPTQKDLEKYVGITLRNFNPQVENKEIVNFLYDNGLPNDTNLSHFFFDRTVKNTSVRIEPISTETVQILMKLHFPTSEKKFFNLPIYCRALRNLTPEKTLHTEPAPIPKPTPIISATDPAQNPTKVDPNLVTPTLSLKFDHIKPIPGLDRNSQLKPLKKKKERKKTSSKSKGKNPDSNQPSKMEDFLISSEEKRNEVDNFEFSEYSSDDSSEEFEDSKDTESENVSCLTPSQLPFCEKLAAASLKSNQGGNIKRPAGSPADQAELKKQKSNLLKPKL